MKIKVHLHFLFFCLANHFVLIQVKNCGSGHQSIKNKKKIIASFSSNQIACYLDWLCDDIYIYNAYSLFDIFVSIRKQIVNVNKLNEKVMTMRMNRPMDQSKKMKNWQQ